MSAIDPGCFWHSPYKFDFCLVLCKLDATIKLFSNYETDNFNTGSGKPAFLL